MLRRSTLRVDPAMSYVRFKANQPNQRRTGASLQTVWPMTDGTTVPGALGPGAARVPTVSRPKILRAESFATKCQTRRAPARQER